MGGLQPPQDKGRSLVGFPDRCPADSTTVKGSKASQRGVRGLGFGQGGSGSVGVRKQSERFGE